MSALSGSKLIINNKPLAYVPNTLIFDKGSPERKVFPQVAGDGRVVNVPTEDFETAKSKVVFELKTTTDNENEVDAIVANFDQNLIKIISPDGAVRVFENATVINKPDFNTGADGNVPVEFECTPALKG